MKQDIHNNNNINLHLISDSTGETVTGLARACLVQFSNIHVTEHVWPMIRNDKQLQHCLDEIAQNIGPVIYTLVDQNLQNILNLFCQKHHLPCFGALNSIILGLGAYFGVQSQSQPGLQHHLDQSYFRRIEALQYVMNHDDGQAAWSLVEADVILVGVSRTSKTPTCIYLANRGIKAANIPIVPSLDQEELFQRVSGQKVIGLTIDPERLFQIRYQRILSLKQDLQQDYTDRDKIVDELNLARKMFKKYKWPTIDVTARSVEETATEIMQWLNVYKQ